MRDILLTMIVFGFIPFILYRPYVGILVWSWLGFMNPHRLCYGFAYDFPYSKIIGLITIVSFLIFYKDKVLPKSSMLLWLLLMFVFWTGITTIDAIYPEEAMTVWAGFLKIVFMVFLTLFMVNDVKKLNMLIAVIVLSLGFYGFKGGLFTLITAGAFHVWGPSETFISENNSIGLALVMVLPLMWYMYTIAEGKYLKRFIILSMFLTAIAVVGTHSRGAFLAIMVMTTFLIMKSRAKFKFGAAVIIAAPLIFAFMPQSWHDRMDSIKNYEQDESAMQRINAWEYSINLAGDHPLTGGGYNAFSEELFARYSNRPDIPWQGPHSIYFETLGEHGYVGLLLFLLMGLTLYKTMGYVIKRSKDYEDMRWAGDLAAMTQVSIVGYAVAGAFLELATFDLYYMFIAIGILTYGFLKKRMLQEEQELELGENLKAAGTHSAPIMNNKRPAY